ncbi:MAG: ABC transporter permease [Bacteroidetes bacterium]|nr:MAG: ABC transporter permease [Bacteroidota bacterium]
MNFFFNFGRYILLMKNAFGKPLNHRYFFKQIVIEIDSLGVNSLGIVSIISVFIGAVLVIQTGYQMQNPLIPAYTLGYGVRESIILEFSPTIVNLILAGKIGSSIASQLGTMRVTEQIDALDIMGINSASFLILPKIIAGLFFFPIIVIFSMSIGITGGYLAAIMWGISTSQDFIAGLNYWFIPFEIVYAIIKATFFSFLIISVSAYHGYYAKGGAVDVGKASTKAVVYSSIAILLSNLIITKIILG